MSDLYPFDPDVREHVARLLYEMLPALYRVRDEGGEPLRNFLRVLAAPLAELRQNIEELHADLFIDTCNDWVIPYLAEMVGTRLIFPDALSNRRDVRGTVAFRRRKGTRSALEEMGSDLSGQMVVTQEGWQRLLISQDLNQLRGERTITDLRRATLAESASGPLDSAYHAVDPRSISKQSGRHHPKHVIHWTHPTRLFPVREGTAFDRTSRDGNGAVTDPDLRYTVNPLGLSSPLRVRRAHPGDPLPTDRVPPMHFAASPGDYFDQEGVSSGRFAVRLSGLVGAVATPRAELRQASKRSAEEALFRDAITITPLEEPLQQLMTGVRIEVFAVPVDVGTKIPDVAQAKWRGGALVSVAGTNSPLNEAFDPALPANAVAMIRLRGAVSGAAVHFPGATVEIVSAAVDARHESTIAGLASEGFLRGAILAEIPRTWVRHDRWFYLAADGSVYEAQSTQAIEQGDPPDIEVEIDAAGISFGAKVLTAGPGPAWPPLGKSAAGERMRRVPMAPGRGPVLLHGGSVRKRVGQTLQAVAGAPAMALVFAARIAQAGPATYMPFARLSWTGDDPLTSDAFEIIGQDGSPLVTDAARRDRLKEVALGREANPSDIELVVRFEAAEADLVIPPCEVAFTSDDGQASLIYLPALETEGAASSDWAASPAPYEYRSIPVSVGVDGSARFVGSSAVARYALGAVAPLSAHATLRRRRVRQRGLCGWDHELPNAIPPKVLAGTPAGALDIDPAHGLFALAKTEPPRPYPAAPGDAFRPRPVTVDYLEGYTDHIGARPDAREPILNQLQPRPTRLVSASGKLHAGAPADFHEIPLYHTFSAALAAVGASAADEEVIQFEDSATYDEAEVVEWPLVQAPIALTIQTAEGQRPVLRWSGIWVPAGVTRYEAIVLRGLVLDMGAVQMPPTDRVAIQFCTVTASTTTLAFTAPDEVDALIEVERSITGQLSLSGPGKLRVTDSVIDADTQAILATEGTCELERVTALSREGGYGPNAAGTEVMVLEASHVIFAAKVVVQDRFHGCIRYSRAPEDSVLPRRHRVVDAPVRFVSRSRHDPAHARLAPDADRAIVRGADDGSEMGAFHDVRLAQRQEALVRRLVEFTPAGLVTGVVRMD